MSEVRPIIARPVPSIAAIAALGDIDPLHARLFAMRGLTAPRELDYGLANLAPIGALENIDAAAELVIAHRDRKIIVVGDFDVDGATSTALVLRCLREFGLLLPREALHFRRSCRASLVAVVGFVVENQNLLVA